MMLSLVTRRKVALLESSILSPLKEDIMKKIYKNYPEYDRELSEHYGSTNHCTVIALAVAFCLSTGKAYNACKIAGSRKDWKGIGYFEWHKLIKSVADRFNYKLEKIEGLAGRTLTQVMRELSNKDTYIININGHTCAYRKGILEDWTNPKYSGRRSMPRHKVNSITRVYK